MEKIKLKNGQEFTLIPMGITTAEKIRIFRVTSTLSYEEIKTAVSNTDNISSIDYTLADGNTYRTYADCVSFKGLAFDKGVKIDDSTISDVYAISLSTDAVEKSMIDLNNQIDDLSNTVVMISML